MHNIKNGLPTLESLDELDRLIRDSSPRPKSYILFPAKWTYNVARFAGYGFLRSAWVHIVANYLRRDKWYKAYIRDIVVD